MPYASCRDYDEACDWFMREDNPFKLMLYGILHFEEMHGVIFEQQKAKLGPAAVCQHFIDVWRKTD